MKKGMVMAAVLVVVFAAGAFAQGQGMGMGKGMGKGCGMGMGMGFEGGMMAGPRMVLAMASELNLTADQMDKIKKITDGIPDKGANREEMQKAMEELKAEMAKDKPDQVKIDSIIDKMAAKHAATMKEMVKARLAVDTVLTKEQKEILKKEMKEKKEKRADKAKCRMQGKGK